MSTTPIFSLIEEELSAMPGGPPTGPAGGVLSGTYPNPGLATSISSRLGPTPTGAGKVIIDTGTTLGETAVGTSGQLLQSNGAAAPTWATISIPTLPISEANGGLGSDTSALTAGLLTKTAANTYVTRSLTAPAAGITITNPAGTAGSPTFALANDLAAVEGLSGTGLAVRTATDTWTNRTLSSGTGTTVTNGDGVSGNPSVNVTYGTSSSTATQGNDSRLPPTPTAGGKILYDTGSAYAESAAGTSGSTILVSGGTGSPTWGTRGGSVVTFFLNTGQSWSANSYLGLAGDGSSSLSQNIVGWRAPAAGVVSNLTVYGLTNTSGSTVITIYKATSATTSPTYSSTALTCTLGTGTNNGSDTTHSFTVNAGDLIVAFSNASWAVNGACVNVMWYPT